MKKVNEQLVENGLIITFNSTHIPHELKIGYEIVKVKKDIASPLKCRNCQKFGHRAQKCGNKETCENSAKIVHIESPCKEKTECINCKEDGHADYQHKHSDKECPIFKKEKK